MLSATTVLSAFFVLATVASTTFAFPEIQFQKFSNSTKVELVTFDDIDEVLSKSELSPVSLRSTNSKRVPLHFTFGSREQSGDYLVSQGSGFKFSSSSQTVQMQLSYPFGGKGAVVSYIEINVEQTNSNARAYIVSGGIKERNIKINVDAEGTNWFKYSYKIYGKY